MPKRRQKKSLSPILKEEKSCMFCLCETPNIVQYDGPCPCKPYLHLQCLESWFINTPNECPLCRTDYDPPSETEQEEVVEIRPRSCVLRIFNRQIQFDIDQYKNIKKNIHYVILFIYITISVYRYINLISASQLVSI
jgi:hypothetical protein